MKRKILNLLIFVLLLLLFAACGKVKQARNLLDTATAIAGTEDKESAQSGSNGVDWENKELTEQDIRKFYTGVADLKRKYPDVEFEVAITASLQAMSEGLNIEKIIEKETDMSFSEYGGLSAAIMLVETSAAGLFLVEDMVSSLESSIEEYESVDTSALTEEEKAENELAIQELKSNLDSAREEMDSPEFRKQLENSKLVMSIRDEMGL